jgi:hypothetical protein
MSAIDEINAAVADLPGLGPFGFFGEPPAALFSAVEEFEKAKTWLSQFPKTKRIYNRGDSYMLKHVAENSIGYTSNGTFIAAAHAAGYKVKRSGVNALFNISSRAFRRDRVKQ